MEVATKPARKLLFPLFAAAFAISACSTPQTPHSPEPVQEPLLAEEYAEMDDGYRLPLAQWAPEGEPKAVVLALHGFNDYHKAFADVGPTLAEQGILTYAYDQRGFGRTETHGEWSSAERMVDDAQAMLELLKARHPDLPVYLMGESMGGAVTISALAAEDAPEIDGAVLIAPAVWARTTMPWYQRAGLWVAEKVAPNWRPTGKSLGRVASNNRDALIALGRDPLVIKKTSIDAVSGLTDLMDLALRSSPKLEVPTLVLYGENDQIVPKHPVCQMLQSEPVTDPWTLGLYPDGYHMLTRDLQGQRVVADIASWIEAPRNELPSGHEADNIAWKQRVCGQTSA